MKGFKKKNCKTLEGFESKGKELNLILLARFLNCKTKSE